MITTSAGATCYDADFYPYGAESNVTSPFVYKCDTSQLYGLLTPNEPVGVTPVQLNT